MLVRQELPNKRAPGDFEKLKALSSTSEYAEGDLDTDTEYYRTHYWATIRQPE
jgi:hypothetical protein